MADSFGGGAISLSDWNRRPAQDSTGSTRLLFSMGIIFDSPEVYRNRARGGSLKNWCSGEPDGTGTYTEAKEIRGPELAIHRAVVAATRVFLRDQRPVVRLWDKISALGPLPPDISPHVLRHGFASVAADLGYSDSTIGALLGHKGHTVTARYTHAADAVLLAAADAIAHDVLRRMDMLPAPASKNAEAPAPVIEEAA